MSESQTLIPVEQDTIDFDGYPVTGVRLSDGRKRSKETSGHFAIQAKSG